MILLYGTLTSYILKCNTLYNVLLQLLYDAI